VSSAPSIRPSSAPCELLLKLFTGQRGAVHLGRMLRGDDAGRFVLLREVAETQVAALASDVDIARSIAHPKLLKLLGVLRSEGDAYLASEYVPGVALTELRDAVRKTSVPIRASVAARIVRDALDASLVASKLLKDAAGIDAVNAFHPDAIWIAEFGETMLSLVAPEQTGGSIAPSSVGTDSAVGLIMQLATGVSPTQVLAEGVASHFPAALAEALSSALARAARSRAAGEAALLEGLNALPPALLATDEQVKLELQRIVPGALLLRRGLQGVEQQDEHELGANEATVVSRLPKAVRVMDAEEPTRAFRLDPGKRDEDPDGITELIKRTVPSVIVAPDASLPKPSSPPASEWAKQFLENTQPSVRRAQSVPPVASNAPAATRRKALLFAALMLVVLLVATVWFLRRRH